MKKKKCPIEAAQGRNRKQGLGIGRLCTVNEKGANQAAASKGRKRKKSVFVSTTLWCRIMVVGSSSISEPELFTLCRMKVVPFPSKISLDTTVEHVVKRR